jgi:hypothetical protein
MKAESAVIQRLFIVLLGSALAAGCGGASAPASPPSSSATPVSAAAPTEVTAAPGTPAPAAAPAPATASAGDGSGESHSRHHHEVATGNTLTEFQKRRLLGHYSTYDGASGFIFDRTGAPFLAKLDGVERPMPLAESDGAYHSKEYRSADHSIWIRVDEEGSVLLFQGPKQHQGVEVARDADAKPLR